MAPKPIQTGFNYLSNNEYHVTNVTFTIHCRHSFTVLDSHWKKCRYCGLITPIRS